MRVHSDAEGVSVPTGQAETAVVGWRVRWIDERRGQTPRRPMVTFDKNEAVRWEISGYSVDALVVQKAAVSTGEHPGMSDRQAMYVPMPINASGEGPADAAETVRTDHQVWWADTNETVCTARDEATARMLADAINLRRGGYEPQANAPCITLPDDLLSLSEAATQGEWSVESDQHFGPGLVIIAPGMGNRAPVVRMSSPMGADDPELRSDADMIVASVNFIRTLAAKQGGKS